MVKLVPVEDDDEIGSFSISQMQGGQPASNTDALSKIRTASGGMLEGIPVIGPLIRGGVERAAAATIAPFSDDTYSQVLERIQRGSEAEKAENPILDTASQFAGGVGGTIPMVMAAPAAFGAGGGSLMANTMAGAASGAALGAADAGVRSSGDLDAVEQGALWGGGLGLAGPTVGRLVGAGVRTITNRATPGLSAAEKTFGRALDADAVTDPAARLSGIGPDAMPMDLGPNLRSQAGAVGSTPGPGQKIVRSAVGERQAGAGERIAGSLDSALGQPADTIALADDIIAKRSAAAKPLYDAAYAKSMPFTPQLKELLERPSMRKALAKAQALAADDTQAAPKQFFAKVSSSERPTGIIDTSGNPIMAPNTRVQFTRIPNVEELDLTKRALDDMISAAQRAGHNNEARILTQQKNLLVGMVDKSVPEYASARSAFSGPSAVKDALEEGHGVFKNSMTPNQLRTRMLKMDQTEKDAFVQGARAQVVDIMGTARNDALAARSTFQKGYNREKLEILVGKDQAKRMLDALDAETTFANTNKEITQQSITAGRQQAIKSTRVATEPGILRSVDVSRPMETVGRIADRLRGASREAAQEGVNAELARLLTSRDPEAITRTVKMVQAAQRRGDISMQRSKEIIQALSQSAAQRRPMEITVPVPNVR